MHRVAPQTEHGGQYRHAAGQAHAQLVAQAVAGAAQPGQQLRRQQQGGYGSTGGEGGA
jgi:hypothetical protein